MIKRESMFIIKLIPKSFQTFKVFQECFLMSVVGMSTTMGSYLYNAVASLVRYAFVRTSLRKDVQETNEFNLYNNTI